MPSRAEWKSLIKEQSQSGKSIALWCVEQGVNAEQFYYRRSRGKLAASKSADERGFIRLDRSEPLELLIGEKLRLRIPARFDGAEVKRLLEALGCNV